MKTKWNNRLLVLLSVLVLALSLTSAFPVEAQTGTTLSISPANYTALTCTDSIISVRVENVVDLNAYELALTFTPGSIEILEILNGNFLDEGYYYWKTYDNLAGTIDVYMTQLTSTLKSGSGDLIYIRFRALTAGATIQVNIEEDLSYLYAVGPEITYTAYNGIITTEDCPPAQLSFFPTGNTVCVGVDNQINVRVSDVYDLYSYGLNLGYETGAIEILNVTNGDFLTSGLYGPFNWPNPTYNPDGTIIFDMSQMMSSTNLPRDGEGNLITITYRVDTPGLAIDWWINEASSSLTNWPDALTIPFETTGGVIYTSTCDPNAVDLLYFDVLRKKVRAYLTWETANELDNAGFNIYRSGRLDGRKKLINPEFIPAQAAGTTMGALYEYKDKPLIPWKTYYYWLEWIDFEGNATLSDPVKAAPPLKK